MNILMLAPLHNDDFQKIEKTFKKDSFVYSTSQDVTQEMVEQCDVIVGNPNGHIDLNCSHLKALLLQSAGSEAFVKPGRLAPQIQLANASGTYGKAIAEHTIGMILTLNKNLKQYAMQMSQHLWQHIPTGKEIYHSTVVIVGLGDLGYELAKRLKAFECHIIGVKRTKCPLPSHIDELYTTDCLDEVLPRADFIILALPQTSETIHLIDQRRLMLMKKDAVLINIGRGSAIVSDDLIKVLKQGHLYGVGLDVIEEEPLSFENELWDFENVLITPHASGGYAWESARHYFTDLVIRNLHHLHNNEPLENEVDFQTGYRKVIDYKLFFKAILLYSLLCI
ncbi:MAG: D-2-hydroxyacid dehydrogenase [Longibaculum sp.]